MEKRRIEAITGGYSFLHIGQLYQTIIDINTEACRKFGAENAGNVMSVALYDRDKSAGYIFNEIKNETGLTVNADDLEFLGKIVQAQQLISEALKLLQGA